MSQVYVRTRKEQAAQDARDKLAEQTGMLLTQIAARLNLGDAPSVVRIIDAVSDLRHFTDRNPDGCRE